MSDLDAVFRRATELHRGGAFAEAEAIYRQVLQHRPDHPAVLNYLGQAQHAQHQLPAAIETLQRAVRAAPGYADAYVSLGNALLAVGQASEALRVFQRASTLKPALLPAWLGCGSALFALERFAEAVPMLETATTLAPQEPAAWLNLANALLAAGRALEAPAVLDRAEALRPQWPPLRLTRARAWVEGGQPAAAIEVLDALEAVTPGLREAVLIRAQALQALGQAQALATLLDSWLERHPKDADAHNARGLAFEAAGAWTQAVAHFEQALAHRPHWIVARLNGARVLRQLGRWQEATAHLDAVLAQVPHHVAAQTERAALAEAMGDAAQARAWHARREAATQLTQAHEGEALGQLLTAAAHQCRWQDNAALQTRLEDAITNERGVRPFTVLSWLDDPALQWRAARTYTQRQFATARQALPAYSAPTVVPGRRLRVAYLSSDFHDHATMYLAARLFELHDRTRFEVWGVSIGPTYDDAMRQRAEAAFEHFIDLGQADTAMIVTQLRALELDIAVDLKGYTAQGGAEAFAARVAPAQINYLGYPGTMGAEFMDYLIADATLVPAADFAHYTERVIWLPDSYQPNDDTRAPVIDRVTRAEVGLPDDALVLCCFNNAYKLKPAFFAIWMRILAQVRDAVLWLWVTDPQAQAHLHEAAAQAGIARERIVFAPSWPHHRHLARLPLADLFVDTLPTNAHTTTADALWSGVPVVTCLGRSFAGRVAASLLRAAALPELVTTSIEAYEARVLALANDRSQLQALRQSLIANRRQLPLFDSARYTRHLEAAYAAVVDDQRRGLRRALRVLPGGAGVEPV